MKYGNRCWETETDAGEEPEVEWTAKEQTTEEQRKENVLEFHHVGLQYKNAGAESLSNVDFTVKPGETVGIIGGTGSGKTSLVNLIPRFYDATSGSILLAGHPIQEYSRQALCENIAVVPQKAVLFAGTVEENLRWGKKDATKEELDQALEISQAKEFVYEKPEGLQTVLEQGGKNLSGGQRQRLTIARALVRQPRILILDDSASALDYATDAKLRKAIRQMPHSPVVFIVSQRTSSIQYADKILVLEDGEVAGIGTHEELLKTCPVYQEIYYSQFPKEGEANG